MGILSGDEKTKEKYPTIAINAPTRILFFWPNHRSEIIPPKIGKIYTPATKKPKIGETFSSAHIKSSSINRVNTAIMV